MATGGPEQNPLVTELATYRKLLPSLLDRAGDYAVIVGDRLLGTYSTWEDACKIGYNAVGYAKPFLVKRIEELETTNFFTRDIAGACRI